MYKRFLKPVLDFIVALTSVTVLSPVFILFIFILLFTNRGKVFFIQERPGKDGRIFRLIKFKTMTDTKDDNGSLLPDNLRLTKTGKLMRHFSIDELPQLLNILKGDMSFVGPRPLLKEYLPLYNAVQARRHEVKPGITGWAQINGRNTITWEQKFEYDVYYVDSISALLDLRIILKTVKIVFKGEGINYSGENTMPVFQGDKNIKN
ncbi:MAG TPA: sugar transferase [Bacteroidales bacterium]|jgi:lipopolysaccharide/colanic/teichoic acid biosynthesis glycosyltransferase|nr:sugar transferase [Bacteroidales bacterium]